MARVFISHSSRDDAAAAQIKDWLTQEGFEAPFLDFDKHAGIPPGANWEQVLYREIDLCDAVVIVQTPNWLDSKWCFAEFTQARALGKPVFPVIHTPTGETLIAPDIHALDLTRDVEGGLSQLARALSDIALDAQSGFDWDRSRPPYPGLLAFQQEDAAVYFGRDDDIRRVTERLNARRTQGGAKVLALLGASGSGKSSLMRAGLIPRLARAGRNWIIVPPMRPQTRPLDELARALAIASAQGPDWRTFRDRLQEADLQGALAEIVADLRMQHAANEAQILVPVDQAEELFGASDPEQAAAFMAVLNAFDALPDGPIMALLAMRSDYLGDIQAAPALNARFEEISLGPMPLARIPQIIEGPARVANLGIDAQLVHQAANDAETEDALPLLAFALRELYDSAADDNYLSLEEYTALGDATLGLTPLENAVRRAADMVLEDAQPSPDDLSALREAFIPAMVRINTAGDYVRQPARWDDLPIRAQGLLNRLADARLLIVRQEDDAKIVEVAHEALLRKWPKLRGWLDDAREFLAGKQQLEGDLRDWEQAADADKPAALLSGLKLTRARGWLIERPKQLSDAERSYIEASVQRADAEAARLARNRKRVLWTSIAASVVMAALGAVSLIQRGEAVAARDAAERAQSDTARALEETQAAQARTATALEETQAAQAATERAFRARATDMLRFAWSDLGEQVEERNRLSRIAFDVGVPPSALVPEVLVCANTFCTEFEPQEDGYDCKTSISSGFRYLYCSIRGVINLDRMQSIAGMPIFLDSSPHGSDFTLDSEQSFGHYNPAFFEWLDAFIVPDSQGDPRLNALTRVAYDTYVSDMARALYHTHQILFSTPEDYAAFERNYAALQSEVVAHYGERLQGIGFMYYEPTPVAEIKAEYQDLLAAGEALPSFYFEQKFFPISDYLTNLLNDDWYLSNTAGGFWVRRSIDGTEAQVFALVTKLLAAFEPEVLAFDPTQQLTWQR